MYRLLQIKTNEYIFVTNDSNTDDRPLRRTLHLPVLCSARVQHPIAIGFTQNTEQSEVERYILH
jgi:hypothetical protein